MSMLFAATYPERTAALVHLRLHREARLEPPTTRGRRPRRSARRSAARRARVGDGPRRGTTSPRAVDPAGAGRARPATTARCASPGAALALMRMNTYVDVRPVLADDPGPDRRAAPHRTTATRTSRRAATSPRTFPARGSSSCPAPTIRWWTQRPRRDPGRDRGVRDRRPARRREPDRVLATVLFTDIVGSTERAARARRPRLGASCSSATTRRCARELERFRGREIDTAGDGFLATFDGPARAIRCALAIRDGVRAPRARAPRRPAHRRVRAARRTRSPGSPSTSGARVAALAGPGEVLVSRPSATSSPARASSSTTAESTSSRASASGGSTPSAPSDGYLGAVDSPRCRRKPNRFKRLIAFLRRRPRGAARMARGAAGRPRHRRSRAAPAASRQRLRHGSPRAAALGSLHPRARDTSRTRAGPSPSRRRRRARRSCSGTGPVAESSRPISSARPRRRNEAGLTVALVEQPYRVAGRRSPAPGPPARRVVARGRSAALPGACR